MTTLQRQLARHLYRWHRLLGVAAALFLLLLAITGILLNHTSELRLAERHVSARPLLAWYGIKAPAQVSFFAAGGHYVSQWHDHLLFDDKDLGSYPGTLVGAIATREFVVAAFDDRLVLLQPDGELVDIIDGSSGLPTQLTHIGILNDEVVIMVRGKLWRSDMQLSHWQPMESATIAWSSTAHPPEQMRSSAETNYLGEGLPLERVVLDLHSGRLFTRHGPWLMDLVALILIFSTLSGLWLWWRNHQRPRRS